MAGITFFCNHCDQLITSAETIHPNCGGYMCDPCYRHMESIAGDPPPMLEMMESHAHFERYRYRWSDEAIKNLGIVFDTPKGKIEVYVWINNEGVSVDYHPYPSDHDGDSVSGGWYTFEEGSSRER